MNASPLEVLTVGHSSLSYENFLELLRLGSITAIADVRSAPYSRHYPQFNRDALQSELRLDNIAYVFLGDELGGRPRDKRFYCDGVANYEMMANATSFARGLQRVIDGAAKYRIAMLCSEHDPLDCHRCLLVGRALHQKRISVKHILSNRTIISQAEIEDRLMESSGRSDDDFFEDREKRLSVAYRKRASRVAYSEIKPSSQTQLGAE